MSRIKLNNRDVTYFYYISESLKVIANNMVGILTQEGVQSIEKSVLDLLVHRDKTEIEPQESAEEIIERIRNGLGGLK